jgi:pSer/pThr/pTyr-binding forkhead associated (FHA) protein
MLEPVSVALKFGFLAVLYLFLLWVAWSALRDLRRGTGGAARAVPVAPSDATSMYQAAAPLDGDVDQIEPRLLVERASGHEPGTAYEIPEGATLGRGDVEIQLDDPFASARHARISRQGHVFVIEDLGSTNGTYLNEEPLSGPQPLHPGDRIRIGGSEFSYIQ